jgi:hypothetical protein
MPLRCCEIVTDQHTHRKRKCKLTPKFFLKFGDLCTLHCKMKHSISAIKIQSVWIGYRNRVKLRKLYLGLPRDLQLLVLKFSRESYSIERQHTIINRIIHNRYINLSFDNIMSFSKFFMKYSSVLKNNEKNNLYKRISDYVLINRWRFGLTMTQTNDILHYYT